jgi:hypothetical protein
MASFVSNGFLKPLLLVGNHNLITGNSHGGSTNLQFITSLDKSFMTSDNEIFRVRK